MERSKILFRPCARNVQERKPTMEEIMKEFSTAVQQQREKITHVFLEIAHIISESGNVTQKDFTREQ